MMERSAARIMASGRGPSVAMFRETLYPTSTTLKRVRALCPATLPAPVSVAACPLAVGGALFRATSSWRCACVSAAGTAETVPLEVEVKVRLPSREDHDKVLELLKDSLQATYEQENYFFDGSGQELSSRKTICRVRLYNGDEKATLTIKGKGIVKDGISRLEEMEEPLQPEVARKVLQDPNKLLELDSALLRHIIQSYNITGITALGGFKNVRKVCDWQGYALEIDETLYDWGTLYELELETEKPEFVQDRLKQFCTDNDIQHSDSKASKFANFINRRLD